MKPAALRRIERLAHRKTRSERVIDPELARALTEVSAEVQRQVGVLIDRRGQVKFTIVGDARSVFLPDLSNYRLGRDRLCGLRLIHTHLHPEGLDDDDLTDLALLRLDLVAAVQIESSGLPGPLHMAHLLPANDDERPWEFLPVIRVHDLPEDFTQTITALEEEFARKRIPRRAGDLRDRAILIHVSEANRTQAEESLAELKDLARSAGIHVVAEVHQRRPVDPNRVLGKGKLQEVIIKALQLGAETLVFDLNLTPAQVKNLAGFTDLKVLDRTQVILDIFAQRAETREGKIQVELAQLRYLLPRLSAKHTALSRLTGGIGGRGPGETKLEINRRRAQERLTLLQREVKKLGSRRRLRRNRRTDRAIPTVAIVGYTNAGKSTLLNRLTESSVTEQDALFATLNPVSRRLRLPQEREIIITDTVGFIRQLPSELVDAFRTTFEEIQPADILLHVLDASSPHIGEHFATVQAVLAELELDTKPAITVLNKIDRCDPEIIPGLTNQYNAIPLSALDPQTFDPLLHAMNAALNVPELTHASAQTGHAPAETHKRNVI